MRITLAYLLVIAATASAALGPDLVRNGNFFVNEQWQAGTGWTIADGNALHISTGFSRGSLVQAMPDLVAGVAYEVRYTVSDMSTVGLGYITVHLGGTEGDPYPADYEVVETLVAGDSGCIEFEPVMAEGSTCRIDNVSVRRVIESTLAGDFDDDGTVDVNDLSLLAADWLVSDPNITTAACDADGSGRVDYGDFAVLAGDWLLNSDNRPPVAADQAASVMVGYAVNITLSASDPDNDYLTYKITQSPTLGSLTRISGGVYRYRPYLDSEGDDTIKWRCSDGKEQSNEATVTITVLPEVLDNLRYDGPALIEIPDGNNINLDDNCILICWFRTQWPEGTLLSKRTDSGGPGLVVDIRGGCVVTTLAGQDGTEHVIRSNVRVDDGHWWFWGLNIGPNVEYNVEIWISGDVGTGQDGEIIWEMIEGIDPNNAEPLRVGKYRDRIFYGAVDYIANSTTYDSMLGLAGPVLEHRQGDLNRFSPAWYRRFLMDEGSGHTITDSVGGITGSLSNHNKINWSRPDAVLDSRGRQRLRLRGVVGAEMIPDMRRRR